MAASEKHNWGTRSTIPSPRDPPRAKTQRTTLRLQRGPLDQRTHELWYCKGCQQVRELSLFSSSRVLYDCRLATVACLEAGETHSFTKEDSLYTLLTCYPSSARLGSFSFRHVDTLTHLRAGYQSPLEPGPSFPRAPRPCFCGVGRHGELVHRSYPAAS